MSGGLLKPIYKEINYLSKFVDNCLKCIVTELTMQ